MDTIEMDPWKRFNFEDENERMKMPGFNWFNTCLLYTSDAADE